MGFFQIRASLTNRNRHLLSVAGVFSFLGAWAALTYGEIIPESILPSPSATFGSLPELHFQHALVRNAAVSFWRITKGFLLAGAVAIPLGMLMGVFPTFKALIQPVSSPLRFLPIAAVLPVFILWFGMGETMKVMLLFVGIVVYLLPLVVETVENVEHVYLETGYTLGASRWQTIRHILLPASMPSIYEALRVMNGIGWTYIILAEFVHIPEAGGGSDVSGIGYMIRNLQRYESMREVLMAVLVILFIGVATDWLLRKIHRRLYHWTEA